MPATIHQEVTINKSPAAIFEALTDASRFSAMTGGAPTKIEAEEGGSFSCFGGMILGRNIELVPNRRIVQAWRVAGWDEGVYSICKFELQEEGAGTRLVFDQAGFPEGQDEHLASGWHENYWRPLESI